MSSCGLIWVSCFSDCFFPQVGSYLLGQAFFFFLQESTFSLKATERKETCHVRMHTKENKVLSLITLFRVRSWWHNKNEKEIQTKRRWQRNTKRDKMKRDEQETGTSKKMKWDTERQRDREGGTETAPRAAFKTKVRAERQTVSSLKGRAHGVQRAVSYDISEARGMKRLISIYTLALINTPMHTETCLFTPLHTQRAIHSACAQRTEGRRSSGNYASQALLESALEKTAGKQVQSCPVQYTQDNEIVSYFINGIISFIHGFKENLKHLWCF